MTVKEYAARFVATNNLWRRIRLRHVHEVSDRRDGRNVLIGCRRAPSTRCFVTTRPCQHFSTVVSRALFVLTVPVFWRNPYQHHFILAVPHIWNYDQGDCVTRVSASLTEDGRRR